MPIVIYPNALSLNFPVNLVTTDPEEIERKFPEARSTIETVTDELQTRSYNGLTGALCVGESGFDVYPIRYLSRIGINRHAEAVILSGIGLCGIIISTDSKVMYRIRPKSMISHPGYVTFSGGETLDYSDILPDGDGGHFIDIRAMLSRLLHEEFGFHITDAYWASAEQSRLMAISRMPGENLDFITVTDLRSGLVSLSAEAIVKQSGGDRYEQEEVTHFADLRKIEDRSFYIEGRKTIPEINVVSDIIEVYEETSF